MGLSLGTFERVFACIRTLLLVAAACFAAATPAAAQLQVERLRPIPGPVWGGWEDLQQSTCTQAEMNTGTCFTISSQADCVSTAVNRIDCFAMAFGGVVARRQWDGQTWQPWRALPSISVQQGVTPECVGWDQGRIDCFARDTNAGVLSLPSGRPLHFPVTTGSAWAEMGIPPGVLDSDPECLSAQAGRLDCFGRGTDGALYHNILRNGVWSGWIGRGDQIHERAKPSCVAAVQRGSILCMFITPAKGLREFEVFLSTGNTGFRNMVSGSAFQVFDAVNFGPRLECVINIGRVNCFTLATNGGPLMLAWLMTDSNSSWVLWNSSGSDVGGSQAVSYDWDCVAQQPDRIDCMELSTQRVNTNGTMTSTIQLRHGVLTPSTGAFAWYNAALGAAPTGFPAFLDCVSWAADRIDCFASGAQSGTALWHAWFAAPPSPTVFNPNRPRPAIRRPSN
jgi:hypothetical protein